MAKHNIPHINNIHPGEFHLDRGITHSPWYLRQVVYTTAGIIGLAVTALGIATPGQVSDWFQTCLLYTSPSPRDMRRSRMPSSA